MKHESIACVRVECTAMPSLSVVIPGNENGAWVYLIPGIQNPEAGMTLPKSNQTNKNNCFLIWQGNLLNLIKVCWENTTNYKKKE